MNIEQAKQKAKKYARKHETILNYHHDEPETDFDRIENAYLVGYLAGAHSLDKEIKELKKKIKNMGKLLELKKHEEFESNMVSEIQITEELKNVFNDVFKHYNSEDEDANYDMENENFSEILKTGKYFNTRYQLNKEKYNEFLKKYTPTNEYYYSGYNKKESEIIKIQDNLIYVASDLYFKRCYDDNEFKFKGFNAFVHLFWIDPKEYNEELGADIPQEYAEDWFVVELKSPDDCDKLVKLLLDIVECLGMPDIEYLDKLIENFTKKQERINKTINTLKSIK